MSLEEENPEMQWPKMPIADLRFAFKMTDANTNSEAYDVLMKAIVENDMAPYYKDLCEEFGLKRDEKLYAELAGKNEAKFVELENALKETNDSDGDTEVRDAYQNKANYYCQIGSKDEAIKYSLLTQEKCIGSGRRLDSVFQQIRVGLFFNDKDLTKRSLEKARSMVEEGGDWDRRNRFRVYDALFELSIRNFEKASSLFLGTVATFNCLEILDYDRLVSYAVVSSLFVLNRSDLKRKVLKCSDILEVLYSLPTIRTFVQSLYECQYELYFRTLADIEHLLQNDRYFSAHYRFYVREMKIKAYKQILESYQSVRIIHMANAFGVTPQFIDDEIAKFVADGRLACKIDKVNEIIITSRPDTKSRQYQQLIVKGDNLLNKMQKLSRIVNV